MKLRVGGVPEHFNLPWHQAIEANAFEATGVDLEFIEYPGGTGAMTKAMDRDEIDIALLLFEGAVSNVLRGHENRLVKVYVRSPLVWGIHVSGKSDFREIDDIRGKVYATSRAGSGSHLIAIVDANERGWSTEGMKFSKVGDLSGAREKLANGKVDVFLWERFTTQPLVDTGEFRRIGQRKVPWPAFVVSVRQSVLDRDAAAVRRVLEVVDDYCQKLKQSPGAVDLISQRYGIDPSDTQQWFNDVEWNMDFAEPPHTIQLIADYLMKLKIVDNCDRLDRVWFDLDSA